MIKRILIKIKSIIDPKPIYVTETIYSSYSQAGEDAVLNFLITDKKMNNISYLDIGTNTPDFNNNTFLLYQKGYRGVCVEADKSIIPEIISKRPNDKVINAGVAVSDLQEADFFIFDNKGLNTFDKREAEKRQETGNFKLVEIAKVPLVSINNIIKNNFNKYPDFLSIDIEGLDLEVLKSLDFDSFPIPIICVETCQFSENHIRPKDLGIVDFVISKGYEVYADTYINTIFVNNNWFYSK